MNYRPVNRLVKVFDLQIGANMFCYRCGAGYELVAKSIQRCEKCSLLSENRLFYVSFMGDFI